VRYTASEGLAGRLIRAAAVDNQGALWFATDYGEGISGFDGVSWKSYTTKDGLAHNRATAIAVELVNQKNYTRPESHQE